LSLLRLISPSPEPDFFLGLVLLSSPSQHGNGCFTLSAIHFLPTRAHGLFSPFTRHSTLFSGPPWAVGPGPGASIPSSAEGPRRRVPPILPAEPTCTLCLIVCFFYWSFWWRWTRSCRLAPRHNLFFAGTLCPFLGNLFGRKGYGQFGCADAFFLVAPWPGTFVVVQSPLLWLGFRPPPLSHVTMLSSSPDSFSQRFRVWPSWSFLRSDSFSLFPSISPYLRAWHRSLKMSF